MSSGLFHTLANKARSWHSVKKYIKRKIDKISVQSSVDAVSCKTDMMLYWVWSPGYSEPASLLFIRKKNKLLLKVEKKTRDQMEALFLFSCWKWRLFFIERFSWIYCTTLSVLKWVNGAHPGMLHFLSYICLIISI